MPKHLDPAKPCPCDSGRPYGDCCRAYHRREREAPDVVALMRSRFSAFVLEHAEYLVETLHPEHADKARPAAETLRALRRASKTFEYQGLQILDSDETRVLFLARLAERGQDRSFVELSQFRRVGAAWRYLSGDVRPAAEAQDLKLS